MDLKQILKGIIFNALEELKIDYEQDKITIEVPKDRKNGDFS